MSKDEKFIEKLEHLSGLKNSPRLSNSSFVLGWTDEIGYSILEWPTDNPPTIAEIEAVELPAPTPAPNWPKFQDDLIKSTAYRRIVGANSNTLAIAPVLSNLAFLISTQPEVIPRFVTVWNEIATLARPTSSERTALNSVATSNNVPFQLNAQGLIEI